MASEKLKIAFIYPSTYKFSRQYSWEVRWIYHGLGLLIAACKQQGIEGDLIDLRRLFDWNEYIRKIANYDVICFSVMSVDYETADKAIEYARQLNPSAKIIVGGTDPSIRTWLWEDDERINHIVTGEGEITLPKIIKGEITERIVNGEQPNLNDMPYIDRTQWEEEYPWGLNGFTGKPPFKTFLSSRACFYRCSFCQPCSDIMFGKGQERRRSVDHFMKELRQNPFESWFIHDDGFLQNRKWVDDFVDAYSAEFKPKPLIIQARANFLTQEDYVMKLKNTLGLEWCIIGFESGSDKVLEDLNKHCTRKINIDAANNLHKCGVKIFANIMFSTPTETNADADLTLSMIKEIKPQHYSPTTYMPYPGSHLYEHCKKNNLILSKTGNRYAGKPKIKGIDYEYVNKVLMEGYKYVTK